MSEQTFWGIHAGKTGDADTLFLKKNFVAVGWIKIGDLSSLKAEREAFKERVAEAYPDKKPGAIANNAGQLFRFVHEMRNGDNVIYPSKHDRQIHIGQIIGPYRYEPSIEAGYPHLPIDWTVRENVRAHLRVIVKRILRKHGYPPDKQKKATDTVLEQAKLLALDWAA